MGTSPEEALSAVDLYCESRTPQELRDEIKLECSRRGNSISIVERRPPWKPGTAPSGRAC